MVDENVRYDSWREALSATIHLSGKKIKEVACALWPAERPEKAHQDLLEILNPQKKRKPSLDELSFICNYCGRYDVLYYFSDECNHIRPRLKTSENEMQEKKEVAEELIMKAFEMFKHVIEPTDKSKEHLKVIKS